MGNANVSRLGQINQGGGVDDLFLKVYGGEVMTAFAETNVSMDKHFVRSISSGKSAQFPFTGKLTAAYHTIGVEILGIDVNHAEQIIAIDDLLISHAFIGSIDEMRNHYDVRSIYSTAAGRALALKLDGNVLASGVLAARAAKVVNDGNGGTVLTDADFATVADDLVAGMFASQQAMDEKDVPENDRNFFVSPALYYLLVNHSKAVNRDFDGKGSFGTGTISMIGGLPIVKTNNLPNTDTTGGADPNKYEADFTTTVALAMQKLAVGTVKLLDITLEAEYDIRRQGTLIVAKVALGHGILRPDCAVELKTS